MSIERIQKLLKLGWISACLATFGIFLILSFFNCPASDDYTYARWMREWGFADAQITIFYAWGGRYFSNVLLTLFNALSYSSDYKEFLLPYQFHSVVHILLFVFSTLILFQRIRWISAWWMALIPISFFIQKANLISEFFYWMAGTVTYCSGYIFGALALAAALDLVNWGKRIQTPIKIVKSLYLLLFLGVIGVGILKLKIHKLLITFFNHHPMVFLTLFGGCILFCLLFLGRRNRENSHMGYRATWLILIFSELGCAGSSELSGAMLILTLGFLWLWNVNRERLVDYKFHLPIVFSVIALAINVLAPATANRQDTVDASLLHHWDQAFRTGFGIFSQCLHLIPLFFTGILLSLTFSKTDSFVRNEISPKKATLFFLGYFLVLGLALPILTTYQSGELPLRAINAHVLVMAISIFVFAWFLGKYYFGILNQKLASGVFAANLFLLLFFVFDPGRNNIKDGLFDLTSEEALSFLDQYKTEQKNILTCASDTCEVQPIAAKPKSLCIAPNAVVLGKESGTLQEYKTYSYAFFYGKKFIFQR